jgi:ABC-type glycerol-3-phosphate transport system substrate-binding protein
MKINILIMKKFVLVLMVIACVATLFVACGNDDEEKENEIEIDNLGWTPVQESKFVKEDFSFKFENKTITGLLWVEVEDLSGKEAIVEVSIEDAKVDGESIGGSLTWAEIINDGKFIGIDDEWTGAYDENMRSLDDWSDLVDRIVLKYSGSKHTASTNGTKFNLHGDPVIGTVEISLRK